MIRVSHLYQALSQCRMARVFGKCIVMFALGAAVVACSEPEPVISGGEPSIRRLTEQQYRNVISDVFGDHIVISGRFDPILRQDGLVAVGASQATISASSFDKYENLARMIAEQVVSEDNRSLYMPCRPYEVDRPDDACAQAFFEPVGRMLLRRPLKDSELGGAVTLAREAGEQLSNFYDGLAFGLTSLLVNPNFLFVIDSVVQNSDEGTSSELTGYAKASRLSFFLWNTSPDEDLLAAAAAGDLDTKAGLKAQVDRMMQSRKLRDGVTALFTDMLHFEEFDHLEKDSLIYPALDPEAIDDAREQMILTIQNHLLDQNADYRDIFKTRKTFINGRLGRVYRTSVAEPELWTPYEFPERTGRAGIQAFTGFVALFSHPGRSSPTILGKGVRELLMCQRVPDPPGDIDFTLFNEPGSQQMTARERLAIHNSVASCAGCHKLTDEIGLSLENFDGAGQFRASDQGQVIDASGNLDGIAYEDQTGLAKALSQNPAIPSCLVQQTMAYGLGRSLSGSEKKWFDYLLTEFAEGEYKFKPLLQSIVTSANFFAIKSIPDDGEQSVQAYINPKSDKRSES